MIKPNPNTALLVISFGTSHSKARRKAIEGCEKSLADAFPTCKIARAISSHHLRKMASNSQNHAYPSIREALEDLANKAVKSVMIQPLHIIPGYEYEKVRNAARYFTGHFDRIYVAKPLLTDAEDFNETAMAFLPLHQTLEQDECLVLMGHGTRHPANQAYADLEQAFLRQQMEKVLVATVEGQPKIQHIIPELKARGIHKVILRPLLLVAGEHAHHDMAGRTANSWKSILEEAGFIVRTELVGLGELEAIREIYIRHAHAGLEALQSG